MNKIDTKRLIIFYAGLAVLFLLRCDRDPTPSIFVVDQQGRPDPVITGMIPEERALAGIGEITIMGRNFSPVMEENSVLFNGNPATILSATTTQITVQSPNLPGDSLEVKISVAGSFLFSNTIYYTLESAIEVHADISINEDMYGLTADKDENLYISVSRDGGSIARRIDRVLPDGTLESGWGSTTFLFATHMRTGPDGGLYLARNTGSLYRIDPGGGRSEVFARIPGDIYDLDFNREGSMYAAGDGDSLYLVQVSGDFESVAIYPATFIRGVRVFSNYVYVAGNEAGSREAVWRNRINTVNSLGANELVFDLTARVGANREIQALTFAEDGDMYLSITNNEDPILIVHPDGSFEVLYPGVIPQEDAEITEIRDMAWGTSLFLYINRFTQSRDGEEVNIVQEIMKVNMQKNGAPYYGRDL